MKCDICDKAFNNQQTLEKHVKCVHEDMKIHTCENCEKTFNNKGNLKAHFDAVHLNIKDFLKLSRMWKNLLSKIIYE